MRSRLASAALAAVLLGGIATPVLLVAAPAFAADCSEIGDGTYDYTTSGSIDPPVVEADDPSLDVGKDAWDYGTPGERITTWRVTCEGGAAVATDQIGQEDTVQPTQTVHRTGTRQPTTPPSDPQPGTPTTPRPGATATPRPSDPAAPVVVPTATPTPTNVTELELEPTYYDEPNDPAGQNLLATGALAGALITVSVILIGALLYRRYFRYRIRYRAR